MTNSKRMEIFFYSTTAKKTGLKEKKINNYNGINFCCDIKKTG